MLHKHVASALPSGEEHFVRRCNDLCNKVHGKPVTSLSNESTSSISSENSLPPGIHEISPASSIEGGDQLIDLTRKCKNHEDDGSDKKDDIISQAKEEIIEDGEVFEGNSENAKIEKDLLRSEKNHSTERNKKDLDINSQLTYDSGIESQQQSDSQIKMLPDLVLRSKPFDRDPTKRWSEGEADLYIVRGSCKNGLDNRSNKSKWSNTIAPKIVKFFDKFRSEDVDESALDAQEEDLSNQVDNVEERADSSEKKMKIECKNSSKDSANEKSKTKLPTTKVRTKGSPSKSLKNEKSKTESKVLHSNAKDPIPPPKPPRMQQFNGKSSGIKSNSPVRSPAPARCSPERKPNGTRAIPMIEDAENNCQFIKNAAGIYVRKAVSPKISTKSKNKSSKPPVPPKPSVVRKNEAGSKHNLVFDNPYSPSHAEQSKIPVLKTLKLACYSTTEISCR